MNNIINVLENIKNLYSNVGLTTTTLLSVLLVVLVLGIYEFFVYRYVSHRSFYNKAFNISIAIIPFFISTIILCLQSNIVITLGTIGALAIIRFRTAVKDPVDMLYLLWSIHTGIICGCQLYEVAILTSLVVTFVLFVFENVKFGRLPHVIIIHCKNIEELKLKKILSKYSKKYRIKSRNVSSKGVDYAIEISVKKISELTEDLKSAKFVKQFSIIEYDADDIL